MFSRSLHPLRYPRAFTLVELLVASSISLVVIGALMAALNYASGVWTRSQSNHQAFQTAATAFETLTRNLSQAVLNTYWSYDNPSQPQKYIRASELHFALGFTTDLLGIPQNTYPGSAVFFQAPLGRSQPGKASRLPARLNAVGFFTAFGSDPSEPSALSTRLSPRHRYRLFEWTEPTSALRVYRATGMDWFTTPLAGQRERSANVSVLGENVVALFLVAEYPGADGKWTQSFVYNSRDSSKEATFNQLPPQLKVALLAIDETSAARLAELEGNAAPLPLPEGKFEDPAKLDDDLAGWEAALRSQTPRVNTRVFRTVVPIPNSRWSTL